MRALAILAVLTACGGKKGDDQPPPDDDAFPLPRCTTPTPGTKVQMRKIAQVNGSAILVTAPRGDLRLFVIEQTGAIRIVDTERLLPEPFLDLSGDAGGPVVCCGEQGLLGLAFHPQYATNGTFFVTYTARNTGDANNPIRDVLARCQVSATDPNKADASSCVDVLAIPDFASNHNGGMIEFGSDGFLYMNTGDGGQANDPNGNGQAVNDGDPFPNTHALLAKMLRIDVDNKTAGKEYGIPTDNPFAAGGGRPEIFMRGLRNAWRWTFDRETGDMWLADVGQDLFEELTVLRPPQQNGANLGWNLCEGKHDFRGSCATAGLVAPQQERRHSDGYVSITGGQVYRGMCYPDLVGTYYYTDFGKGGLATAKLNGDDTLALADLSGSYPGKGSSIHEDGLGELYETDTNGNVFQLVVVP